MTNRLFPLLYVGFFGLASTNCLADDSFPRAFERKPASRFAPSSSEFFGPLAPAAKRLVLAEEKNRSRQHFCAIGYKYPEGAITVWVHWKEGQRLLLWRGDSDHEMREKGLVDTNRDLKLRRDTIERKEELNGSTFMETRAWWEAVAVDCAAHGEKVTLAPFSSKSR